METEITESEDRAAEVIRAGGLVAFPTETVYGIGADAFNVDAVGRIFEAKKRPADNPLIVHIGTLDQIDLLASDVTASAEDLIEIFFPGPLTIVLKRMDEVPDIVTAGLDTVGIRMPALLTAHRFLEECGRPVAAPSANLSGRPSSTSWEAVFDDLAGRIDCILRGNVTEIGLESTVVDCTGRVPAVLRHGAVTMEMLRTVIFETIDASDSESETPRSPGQKHVHYSPKALVKIVEATEVLEPTKNTAYIGLNEPKGSFVFTKIAADAKEYAALLFEFFRECDRQNVAVIYCETVSETGIGKAVMDRLRRAAEI